MVRLWGPAAVLPLALLAPLLASFPAAVTADREWWTLPWVGDQRKQCAKGEAVRRAPSVR